MVAHLVGAVAAQAAAAVIPAEELVTMIVMLQAVAVVPTTHPARMRLVQQAYGKVTDRWLLPIALVFALNLRRWWPITVTWILPLLQEPITPMAAAAPWKLLTFP